MTSQYVYVLGADRRGAGQNLQVCPDTFFGNRREQLLALAARHAVPVIYARREWSRQATDQLWSEHLAVYRQAGVYVRRILKGAKPADLPVQQPTTFELRGQSRDREVARIDDPAIDSVARRRGD